MNVFHNGPPFLDCKNVSAFPMRMRLFLARERSTLSRSGEDKKPMSPLLLLRVSETMTISLSSPWKLSVDR
jgi:hypothetical protein